MHKSDRLLKSDVLDGKTQIKQVTVNSIRRIPFCGLRPVNGGTLTTKKKKEDTTRKCYLKEVPLRMITYFFYEARSTVPE